MDISKKQLQILQTISVYRQTYGRAPTFREIVEETEVSDVKSVHRMISTLINKGFLKKEEKNSRSILLTPKTLELLIRQDSFFPLKYDNMTPTMHRFRQPTEIKKDTVTVLSPTTDFLGYKNNQIKISGTTFANDLETAIKSAVNDTVSSLYNGTLLGQTDSVLPKSIIQVINDTKIVHSLVWTVMIPLSTWLFTLIGFSIVVSLALSMLTCIFINIINKFISK